MSSLQACLFVREKINVEVHSSCIVYKNCFSWINGSLCVDSFAFFPLFIFLLTCCTDPRLTNKLVSNIFFINSDQTTLSIGLSA